MTSFLTVLLALGLSGSKYVIGVAFILYQGFSFVESLLLTVGGGMLGCIFFGELGNSLKYIYKKIMGKKSENSTESTPPNTFQKWVQKIQKSYGLAGIAFITPCILTVPVGAMLATSLFKNRWQVYSYMFVSFMLWSVALCGLYEITGIDIKNYVSF